MSFDPAEDRYPKAFATLRDEVVIRMLIAIKSDAEK